MDILQDIDALVVTSATNIRYLTGFVGADPHGREAYVLVWRGGIILFTSSLYVEYARLIPQSSVLQGHPIRIVSLVGGVPFARTLADTIQDIVPGRSLTIGYEASDLTVLEHKKMKDSLGAHALIATENRIEFLRRIKRDDEILLMKQAGQLTDECFLHIEKLLIPGVNEREIAWDISSYFHKRGGADAFPPIVAFGPHASQPHYLPSETAVLQENQAVLLDFGARVNGYCADMTRCIHLGTPPDEWTRAYRAVYAAQKKALAALQSRTETPLSGAALDRDAQTVIKDAGFTPYQHSLGHSLGLDIHEAPRLTVHHDELLMTGMTFTVEPGVYVEGKYGIRIEDAVYLTDSGYETFTHTKK